jgi:hypothetical protein
MKILTTAAFAAVLCLSVAARAESKGRSSHLQMKEAPASKLQIGVDGDFALPVGNYSDINGIGVGAMVTAEYPLQQVLPELSATARVGFQFHTDKNLGVAGADVHVHSIPVLFGAKYYFMPDRQGVFGAAELGFFDLLASTPFGSDSSVKFGMGVGAGYQWHQWNARINVHTHDVGNFGDAVMMSAGVGYQFAGL